MPRQAAAAPFGPHPRLTSTASGAIRHATVTKSCRCNDASRGFGWLALLCFCLLLVAPAHGAATPAPSSASPAPSPSLACCAPGTSGPFGNTSCTPCSDGTYSNTGASTCLACPAGHNRSTGCSATRYWDAGLRLNWTDAFAYCASRGGTLPVLNTRCTNDNFKTLFRAAGVVTAGTRLPPYSTVPNQWQWVTNLSSPREAFYNGTTTAGTCLTSCSWHPSQPDAVTGELCMITNWGTVGAWNDIPCTFAGPVVCEAPMCPPGFYADGLKQTCGPCPAGTYNPFSGQNGSAACLPCPGGVAANPRTGQAICVPCPPGAFANSSSVNCACCAAGFFSPGNSTPCTPCSDGTYSNTGASTCLACPAGHNRSTGCSATRYWNTALTMNWTDAFAYCASRGGTLPVLNTRCINDNYLPLQTAAVWSWTAGTRLQPYSSVPDQWQWVTTLSTPGEAFYNGRTHTVGACLAGKYCNWSLNEPSNSSGGLELCLINRGGVDGWMDAFCGGSPVTVVCEAPVCPIGSFATNAPQTCAACPVGTFTAHAGAPCTPCLPGTFASAAGQAVCSPCPPGTFAKAGQTACSPCPAGTYNPHGGSVSNASCLPCFPGTFGSDVGAASWESCRVCPSVLAPGSDTCTTQCLPGTFINGTACLPCPVGTYSKVPNAEACTICPRGTFGPRPRANSSASCESCPAGTYGEQDGASAASSCMPCPHGTYGVAFQTAGFSACRQCPLGTIGSRSGAPNATTCEPCPGGQYSAVMGAAACELCQPGTYSAAQGSKSASVCRPCPAGNFSSASGMTACTPCPAGTRGGNAGMTDESAACIACPPGSAGPSPASTVCLACHPGWYGNASGLARCEPCLAGTFAGASGQLACQPCGPGSFSNVSGAGSCYRCPEGQLQLESGKTDCTPCSAALQQLPAALDAASSFFDVEACTSLSQSITLNWMALSVPAVLGARGTVLNAADLPPWLHVAVDAAALVSLTSAMIPASAGNAAIAIRLGVNQTCRAAPWMAELQVRVSRTDPAIVAVGDRNGDGVVVAKACPSFSLQFAVSPASCGSQRALRAIVVNATVGTSATLTSVVSDGRLLVTGTITTAAGAPADAAVYVAVEAQLGSDRLVSAPASRVTLMTATEPRFAPPSPASAVQACPFVSVTFSLVELPPCGVLVLTAALAGGSPLPIFLRASPGIGILVVTGSVPDGHGPFSIVGQATWNGRAFTSDGVTVTRSAIAAAVTVQAVVGSGGTAARRIAFSSAANDSAATSITSEIQYGTQFSLTAAIDSLSKCTAVELVASTSPPNPAAPREFAIPWLSVASTTGQTSLTISGSPPKEIVPGTPFVFYVWANDGIRNPSLKVTLVVHLSLALSLSPTTRVPANASTPQLPIYLSTPSALVSLLVVVQRAGPSSFTGSLTLLCVPQAAAFCSYDAVNGQLTAFGTAEGINQTLQGMQLATTWAAADVNDSVAVATVTDAVNPTAVAVSIPLHLMPRYPAVQYNTSSPLTVNATIGKPVSVELAPFFTVTSSSVSYVVVGGQDWMSVQGGTLTGTPTGLPGAFGVQIVARDAYTQATANVTVNATWAAPPRATTLGSGFSRRMVTSELEHVTLPADVIKDPEGGEVDFEARLSSGGSAIESSHPLPPFITFDARTLQFTLSPTSEDAGTYPVQVWGTTQYGSRWTSASISFVVEVETSLADLLIFFYSLGGFVLSAVTLLATLLLLRLELYGVLLIDKYTRAAPPDAFLTGEPYTLRSPQSGAALQAKRIITVRVKLLRAKPSLRPTAYWKLYSRMPRDTMADDAVKACGVSWVTLAHEGGRATVAVDVDALRSLVASGDVKSGDEYIFEVVGRANPIRLWTAVPLECFLFTPSKVFSAREAALPSLGQAVDVQPPESLTDAVTRLHSLLRAQEAQYTAQAAQLAIQAAQLAAQDVELAAQDAEMQAQVALYQTHRAQQDAWDRVQRAALGTVRRGGAPRSGSGSGSRPLPPRHAVDCFSAHIAPHAAAAAPLALPIAGLDEEVDEAFFASLGLLPTGADAGADPASGDVEDFLL